MTNRSRLPCVHPNELDYTSMTLFSPLCQLGKCKKYMVNMKCNFTWMTQLIKKSAHPVH